MLLLPYDEKVSLEAIYREKDLLQQKINCIDESIKLKGFCNKRERCLFFHTQRVCEDYVVIGVCSQENCEQRHPQNCHSFLQSQCKWGKRCKYMHKEQIIEKIIKSRGNKKENHKDAIEVVETEEEDPLSNCNECTNEDKCIGCIMQRVYNDSFECLDDSDTESIESIMKKAKAFEKDEDMAKETVEDI